MLVETCFLLWCETKDPRICTIQRSHLQMYNEHKEGKEYRHLPYIENGEMNVVVQKLKNKMGCWLERVSD